MERLAGGRLSRFKSPIAFKLFVLFVRDTNEAVGEARPVHVLG